MDAVDYIKNHEKMCGACNECRGCPIRDACGPEECYHWAVQNAEEAVRIVGEWIEAQRVSNLRKFIQVFGRYPDPIMQIDPFYRGLPDEWWQAEYEEVPID